MERTITAALATLKRLIAEGYDYADAEWKAAKAHKVSASRLRAAYDKDQRPGDYIDLDLMYEDDCARQCGLI